MLLTLDLPDHCFPPKQDTNALACKLKLYSALLFFQSGQMSRGAACEFADVDIYTFMAACKQYNIPISNIEPDSIEDDLIRFEKLHPNQ